MRIEYSFAPPQSAPTTTQDRWVRPPATASSLSSPHAPKWGDTVLSFFDWIIAKFLSLFTWCMPKKAKPVSTSPPPEFARAVQQAKEAEIANQSKIPGIIQNGIISYGASWYFDSHTPFTMFVANQAINASSYAIEKVAEQIFPKISQNLRKLGSVSLAIPTVLRATNQLGYPIENTAIFFICAFRVGPIFSAMFQAHMQEQQEIQARLRQAVAS